MPDNNHCQTRISPAIVIYSETVQRPINEDLFVDMVRDILSFARDRRCRPQSICEKLDKNIAINDHCPSG
jgi:hypothetical protein